MEKMKVQLSLGSFTYLSGLAGACGGIVVAAAAAIYYAAHGEWAAIIGALFSPLVTGLTTAFYALVGYPIYRRLSNRMPSARYVTGTFAPTHPEQ